MSPVGSSNKPNIANPRFSIRNRFTRNLGIEIKIFRLYLK